MRQAPAAPCSPSAHRKIFQGPRDPCSLSPDSRMTIYCVQRREENQIYVTEYFIAIIICSTCFGHSYTHHQELETILVLLPHMVCNALVAGGRLLGTEQQAMRPG